MLYELEVSKVDTLLPHLAYVPWITVNGRHNYAVENHLNKAICDTYKVGSILKFKFTLIGFLFEFLGSRKAIDVLHTPI